MKFLNYGIEFTKNSVAIQVKDTYYVFGHFQITNPALLYADIGVTLLLAVIGYKWWRRRVKKSKNEPV